MVDLPMPVMPETEPDPEPETPVTRECPCGGRYCPVCVLVDGFAFERRERRHRQLAEQAGAHVDTVAMMALADPGLTDEDILAAFANPSPEPPKPPEPTPRACAHCGTVFAAVRLRYCSEECKELAASLRQERPQLPPVPCAWCGTEFTPRARTAKFCSRVCLVQDDNVTRLRRRQARRQPIPCAWCGQEFTPKKSDARYCKPECARRGAVRQGRERRAERRREVLAEYGLAPAP